MCLNTIIIIYLLVLSQSCKELDKTEMNIRMASAKVSK